MEIYKYNKYKIKYLNLKNEIKGGVDTSYIVYTIDKNFKQNVDKENEISNSNYQQQYKNGLYANMFITKYIQDDLKEKLLEQENEKNKNYVIIRLPMYYNDTKQYNKYNALTVDGDNLTTTNVENKFTNFILNDIASVKIKMKNDENYIILQFIKLN